ncbi:MAG: hypothetical protein JST69_10155 [Bacteroidetes bacterium]|nr:hypothetical protein [Bacteroidota bacterium]
MKAKVIRIAILFLTTVFFSSCAHRMVGTWTVQRFETMSPGQQGVSFSNIGTMQFTGNGKGVKNLNYSVLGVSHNDQIPFTWEWSNAKYVTIKSEGSDLSKTWIIMTDKKKFQKWKSTDGSNNVHILELKK